MANHDPIFVVFHRNHRSLHVSAARRQFLLGTVLAKQKQELITLITATLNLDLNLTCKLLDYTLDCSTTGKTHFR